MDKSHSENVQQKGAGTGGSTNRDPSDADIFEIIIFTLSPVLGGRDQVLAAPFIEVLAHVEMEKKKRKANRWNQFMDSVYSDLTNGIDKMKRQKYMETLQPKKERKQLEMKTDLSLLEKLKESQGNH